MHGLRRSWRAAGLAPLRLAPPGLVASPLSTAAAGRGAAPPAPAPAPAPRVTPRAASFSAWYASAVAAADLSEPSPVKGCAILKPAGMALWERLRAALDARIAGAGAANAYFPLLIPLSFFAREAAHVDGFAKEVAVVTHHRLRAGAPAAPGGAPGPLGPDPAARLAEPLVVRPTSETLVWDALSRWVASHRDLPIVLNQWASVVRWEMRTRPFLRTSEFLWQEGHSAHATAAEAAALAERMLSEYSAFLTHSLALGHVVGLKSAGERFAGAASTRTCEAMMANGWALQAATSHDLGQSFARAFDVRFTDAAGGRRLAWGTSWGASTRLIGGAIMAHGDDTGVVLPPAVAPTQVVVVPLAGARGAAGWDGGAAALAAARALVESLRRGGVRAALDDDVTAQPGGRFYAWERRGVPLRLEVGPREVAARRARARPRVRLAPAPAPAPAERSSGGDDEAETVPLPAPAAHAAGAGGAGGSGDDDAAVVAAVTRLLDRVQATLLRASVERMRANIVQTDSFDELAAHAAAVAAAGGAAEDAADDADDGAGRDGAAAAAAAAAAPAAPAARAPPGGGAGGGEYAPPSRLFLAPWHDDAAAEADVKARTRFTLRCFPTGGAPLAPAGESDAGDVQARARGRRCFLTGRPATHLALFGRAY